MPRKKRRNQNKTAQLAYMDSSPEEDELDDYKQDSITYNLSDMLPPAKLKLSRVFRQENLEQEQPDEESEDEIQELKKRHSRLTQQLKEKHDEMSKLRADLNQIAAKKEKRIRSATEERDSLRSQLTLSQSELREIESTISAAKSKENAAQRTVAKVSKEIEAIQLQLETPYLQHDIQRNSERLRILELGEFGTLQFKEKLNVLDKLSSSMNKLVACMQAVNVNTEKDMELQCEICCENPRNAVIFPCNHFMMCMGCAHAVSECPFCLSVIRNVREVYKA